MSICGREEIWKSTGCRHPVPGAVQVPGKNLRNKNKPKKQTNKLSHPTGQMPQACWVSSLQPGATSNSWMLKPNMS